MTTAAERLDQVTIDLIFALRDSLTEDVSRLDFWAGRAATAIETAAAGAQDMHEAVTIAARKLQIPTLGKGASQAVVDACGKVTDYEEWAAHVTRNIIYILALARVINDEKKTASRSERQA